MIVRTWHGCVPLKHAEGFAQHLDKTGVDHSKSVPGTGGRLFVEKRRVTGSTFSSQRTGKTYRR